MFKNIIKLIGIWFILWGIINLWSFLSQSNSIGSLFLISLQIGGFSLGSLMMGSMQLFIGYYLFVFNSTGRKLGLILLWINFIAILFLGVTEVVIFLSQPNEYNSGAILYNKNMPINIDIRILMLVTFLIVVFLGVQIFILSSKRAKDIFQDSNRIKEIV